MTQSFPTTITVNEKEYKREVEPRLLLSDFLRHELGLTGTHVGCEHGVCGACTILFDGESMRSCLIFTVQAMPSRQSKVLQKIKMICIRYSKPSGRHMASNAGIARRVF